MAFVSNPRMTDDNNTDTRQSIAKVLEAVVAGTASATGEDFFPSLVRNLAEALGVSHAFVSELSAKRDHVRTLAFWARDHFFENFEYELAGTPCEGVLGGDIGFYPRNVCQTFPVHEADLRGLGAESYLAIPVLDKGGGVIGHLAVIDTKPMAAQPEEMAIFRIFGARAGAEIQRIRTEERFGGILASAMDAIVIFDDAHAIHFFNKAAERMFSCSADWARGQPFDRFFVDRERKALSDYMRSLQEGKGNTSGLWSPAGIRALRAGGEEFPVEGTLSMITSGARSLYTAILRDLTERQRAEETLARLRLEKTALEQEIRSAAGTGMITTHAPAMEKVIELVRQVASADATVLVTGETGTGKELIAHAIHDLSPRRVKPLVKLNCAALPAELIESELFGHEKGAFTGATSQRMGRFELANGGTLFLDEVGELTPSAQAKLLRVLQEREFERVGGTKPIRVDVRVVAATNRDLAHMVEAGQFRGDLYYRLNVFPIGVPPLRDRPTDIPLLADHFLRQIVRRLGKPLTGIHSCTLDWMQRYAWPGNVRELQNLIERGAILAKNGIVEIDQVSVMAKTCDTAAQVSCASVTLEEVERAHIERVLREKNWTIEGKSGAAAILRLNPSTLRFRMQKLGIRKPSPQSV